MPVISPQYSKYLLYYRNSEVILTVPISTKRLIPDLLIPYFYVFLQFRLKIKSQAELESSGEGEGGRADDKLESTSHRLEKCYYV